MVDDVSLYQNVSRVVTFETSLGSRGEGGQGGSEVGRTGCRAVCRKSLKLSVPNSGKGEGCSSSARSRFAARQQSEESTPPRLLTFSSVQQVLPAKRGIP